MKVGTENKILPGDFIFQFGSSTSTGSHSGNWMDKNRMLTQYCHTNLFCHVLIVEFFLEQNNMGNLSHKIKTEFAFMRRSIIENFNVIIKFWPNPPLEVRAVIVHHLSEMPEVFSFSFSQMTYTIHEHMVTNDKLISNKAGMILIK